MELRATGALLSPFDYRDSIASAAVLATLSGVKLKDVFETDLSMLGFYDQGPTPSCVSHSIALALKLYWYRKTGKLVDFSPRFLDILAKRFDGLGDPTNRATQGTYGRIVMKLAATYGCATTATLPNDITLPILTYRDDSLLTDEVMAEAAQFKIPGYIHVPGDFYSLRLSTQEFEVLSIAMFIGKEFYTKTDGTFSELDADIDPLRTPAVILSGHQMVLKGWRSPALNRLRNNWGKGWADNGEANYDAHLWDPFTQEAWAIATVPTDVVTFIKSLPAAGDFHYHWNANMKMGDHNNDVAMAQIAYMILGYLKPIQPGELGYFGPKTAAANVLYQLANHIQPSAGNIGPLTRGALNSQFSI